MVTITHEQGHAAWSRLLSVSFLLLCIALALPATANALTFVVNNTADTTAGSNCQGGGNCTLRAAIAEANAIPEAVEEVITLHLQAGTYTVGNLLEVRRGLSIIGSNGNRDGNPRDTIIQAGTTAGVAANGQLMVINPTWDNGFATRIEAVWIRHAYNEITLYGGAIDWDGSDVSGNAIASLGIYNCIFSDNEIATNGGTGAALGAFFGASITLEKTSFLNNKASGQSSFAGAVSITGPELLQIRDVTMDGNSAEAFGAAEFSRIENSVVIERSTFSNNQAQGNVTSVTGGLGLSDFKAASIANATFSGNQSGGSRGGLSLAPRAMINGGTGARLTNVTITNNRSGTINNNATGGGLVIVNSDAPTVLHNTLVSGNFRGNSSTINDDIQGTLATTSSYNLIGTGGSGGLINANNGNLVGVVDAGLELLADNYGLTRTHALKNNSPALDAGSNTAAGIASTDQRGWPRLLAAASPTYSQQADIGAYEAHPTMTLINDITLYGQLVGAPTRQTTFYVGDTGIGEPINIQLSSSNQTLLPNANLSVSASGTARTLSITPAAGRWGSATVTVTVSSSYNGMQRQTSERFLVTVVPPPDLRISKSHVGDFYQGQNDAEYRIVVNNIGPGATYNISPVVVTESLPASMTAQSISGDGWTCNTSTVSCQRTDVLPTGSSYPAITLTVAVATNAAQNVINTVSVSGGGDAAGDSTEDPTKILYATSTTLTTGGTTHYEQDITLLASMSPANTNISGTVVFEQFDGASWNTLSSVSLSGSTAMHTIAGKTLNVGGYDFRARYTGDANHYLSQSTISRHTLIPAAQSITFAELMTAAVGDTSRTLMASSTSGLPVSFTSSDSSVASISAGSTLTFNNAGTASISASQSGNGNYLPATNVVRTLTVAKAVATVQLSNLERVYSGLAQPVTVLTTPAGLNVAITYDGNNDVPTNAGSYPVNATINENNYSGSSNATLVINKANQTITFATLADVAVGDAPLTLGANSTNGFPLSFSSSNPAVASIVGNTVTIHAAGSTDITASQNGDSNYNAATAVVQTLTVNKGSQTISFDPLPPLRFDDPALTLSASTSSGLPLSYTSSDPSIASISANTVTVHAVGSTTITARQAGNEDYEAATDVQQLLTVRGVEQAITFPLINNQLFLGSALTLTLSASSDTGLPISYSVDQGPASIDGDQLTVHGPGTITVSANQPGTSTVEAATSVSRSFTVTVSTDANWQVSHCAASGSGSLPQIVADAVSGNRIGFSANLQCLGANAISLASHGPLNIAQNLDIDGAGAQIEISGDNVSGLLYVDAAVTHFTLRNLTLRDAVSYGAGSPATLRQALLSHSPDVLLEDLLLNNIDGGSLFIVSARNGSAQLRNITISGNSGGEAPLLVRSSAALNLRAENITLHSNNANTAGAILLGSDNSNLTAALRHITLNGVADSAAPADLRPLLVTQPWGTGNISVTLDNSVLWNNAGQSIDGAFGSGAVTVRHSVIEGGFVSGNNITDSDPMLAPLSHQGYVRYLSPLPGSSAINAADTAACLASDQRGITRTGRCDAGAVQPRPVTLALNSGNDQSAVINSGFAEPLSLNVATAFDEPIVGGRIDFNAPITGASLSGSHQSALIGTDGSVSLPISANAIVGSYNVNADALGSNGALIFSLENLAISTTVTLSTVSPIEAGSNAILSADISANGALPIGNISFERFDGNDWQPLTSVALTGNNASYTVTALAAGSHTFRARFPGSASHTASDWRSVTINVYAPITITDPDSGADLNAGNSREFSLSGGEGSAYDIDISGPNGFNENANILCSSGCSYTFKAPQSGAFAGVYNITVADTDTGWFDNINVNVPLQVDVQRTTLLSRDASRNSADILVRGANIGDSVTLTADAAANAAGITLSAPASASDDAAAGNPASFTISLPDTLMSSLTVSLAASSGTAPQGSATLLAQVASVQTGSVRGPLAEAITAATVTLLISDGITSLPLVDNEGNRYESVTDHNGDFTLIAPPVASGYNHLVEVMAAGYQSISEAAANCGDCSLQMTAAVTAETPRFNPPAGQYPGWVTVRLESTTVGATLRYTLDGSTPTLSNGIEVNNNTELLLATDTTIKVIAYQVGLNVSAVAEASYSLTSARFKSGGGSFGLITLLPLLLLGIRRKLLPQKALTILLLLPAVTAQAENGWYVGGAIGWAMTDIDAGDVESRMADAGISGTATVDDENRFAWKLLAGYHWRYLGLEGGYVNLGDITAGFNGTGPLTLNALQGVPPASGDGYELAMVGRYPFTETLAGFVRAGMMRWQTQYALSGIGSKTFTGTDPTFGIGIEWMPERRWMTRLAMDRYTVEADDSNLISIALAYHFGFSKLSSQAFSTDIDSSSEVTAEHSHEPEINHFVAQPNAAVAETTSTTAPSEQSAANIEPFTVGLVPFRFARQEPYLAELEQVIKYLNQHPQQLIKVVGHTDNSGPEEYNLALSKQRAANIAQLLQDGGIALERLSIVGAGGTLPLASNDTSAGRVLNRRVEIILMMSK